MRLRSMILLSIGLFFICTITTVRAQTFAYIPSSGDGNVTRVNTDDETFTSVSFEGDLTATESGDLYGAAITPQGDYIVVTRNNTDDAVILRTSSFTSPAAQVVLSVGDQPRGVAIESRGEYAYVANYGDDTVTEIYIPTHTRTDTIDIGETGVPDGPWGVAAIYDEVEGTRKVYVANYDSGSISVINGGSVTNYTGIGGGPAGVALTPDGAYLYVALLDDDAVVVVRTSDNTVVKPITVGDSPWGVAVGSDGAYIYVTNSGLQDSNRGDTVTVIDAATQSLYDTFDVGVQPTGVACPKNGDFAYVINQTGNSISRIEIANTAAPVTEIGAGEIDNALAMGAFIGGAPPSAPSGLTTTVVSYDQIDLSWTDNSSDELGFKIERRLDTSERYVQIAKVGAGVTTYSNGGLSGSTAYRYRVRAYNEAADSGYAVSGSSTTDKGSFSWCFIGTLWQARP